MGNAFLIDASAPRSGAWGLALRRGRRPRAQAIAKLMDGIPLDPAGSPTW